MDNIGYTVKPQILAWDLFRDFSVEGETANICLVLKIVPR